MTKKEIDRELNFLLKPRLFLIALTDNGERNCGGIGVEIEVLWKLDKTCVSIENAFIKPLNYRNRSKCITIKELNCEIEKLQLRIHTLRREVEFKRFMEKNK